MPDNLASGSAITFLVLADPDVKLSAILSFSTLSMRYWSFCIPAT